MRSMVEGGMRSEGPSVSAARCHLPVPGRISLLPHRNNRFFIHRKPSQIVSTTGRVSGASTA
jgi:hypothetical protein